MEQLRWPLSCAASWCNLSKGPALFGPPVLPAEIHSTAIRGLLDLKTTAIRDAPVRGRWCEDPHTASCTVRRCPPECGLSLSHGENRFRFPLGAPIKSMACAILSIRGQESRRDCEECRIHRPGVLGKAKDTVHSEFIFGAFPHFANGNHGYDEFT